MSSNRQAAGAGHVTVTQISPHISARGDTFQGIPHTRADDPWTILPGLSREDGRDKGQGLSCYFYSKREIPLRK